MSEYASYRLPTPPSVNALWRPRLAHIGGKTRAIIKKRPAYAQWLQEAGWEIAAQRSKQRRLSPGKPIRATYLIEPPKALRDLDNYLKAINDAAVKFGVIEDDSLIVEIHANFEPSVKGVMVSFEVIK